MSNDRQRDPERISRILQQLEAYWLAYPDMRLGQILVNAIGPDEPCPAVFYAEDDVVERGIDRAITEHVSRSLERVAFKDMAKRATRS